MAVENKAFLIKSIQKRKELIVAYCAFTNMPLVVCDPESYNDQVFIFETEKQLQDFAKAYTEKKILLKGVKFLQQNFLTFYSLLFTIGVNELVFVGDNGETKLELTDIVRKPDYSKLPKEQQPVMNPELQLTGLYFMQEASRPVPNEEKNLVDLEEELSANLLKARYVIPVEFLEGEGTDMEKLKNHQYRLPILKNKKEEIFQPVFTDLTEMAKFNKEKKFRALIMPFDGLSKLVIKDSKGFLLNPGGFHIAMPTQLLKGLSARFEAN